jgi:putative endonuclease
MKTKFYVYILCSKKDNTIYVGLTKDLSKRITEHNNGLSKYTKTKLPWELLWYCVFFDRRKARSFEKYLKSGSGRAFLYKRLISNPP